VTYHTTDDYDTFHARWYPQKADTQGPPPHDVQVGAIGVIEIRMGAYLKSPYPRVVMVI